MKTIAFKIPEFPEPSQTFVIDQIVMAIRLGYNVKILTNRTIDLDKTTQKELIDKYELSNHLIDLSKYMPTSKISKAFKILSLIFLRPSIRRFKFLNPLRFGQKSPRGDVFIQSYLLPDLLENVDLVHIQFGTSHKPLDLLKKHSFIRQPIVTTFHGFDAFSNKENRNRIRNYYKGLFQTGDYFTCNTEYLKGHLLQLNCPQHKLKVIHVPINTELFRPADEDKESKHIQLISVGRLINLKGHQYGIQVVRELIERGYSVHYKIIGTGDQKERLNAQIRELSLSDHVELMGQKNQREIIKLFHKSDIYLMTSVTDPRGRKESQGLVTGEAQACGLPVVAFRSGGIPYTMVDGKTGFLCEEFDTNTMTELVVKLIDSKPLRKNMGQEAREFILQHYSRKVISRQWENVYSDLISSVENIKRN